MSASTKFHHKDTLLSIDIKRMKLHKRGMCSGIFTRCGLLIWAVFLASNLFAQEPAKGPATVAELQQKLTAHVNEARFAAALWGVKVVSVDSGKVLFEHYAQKLFSPASNSKLY